MAEIEVTDETKRRHELWKEACAAHGASFVAKGSAKYEKVRKTYVAKVEEEWPFLKMWRIAAEHVAGEQYVAKTDARYAEVRKCFEWMKARHSAGKKNPTDLTEYKDEDTPSLV